jgi:hypothetical protein
MSTSYLSQWSHTEIMSMHGIELEDMEANADLEHDEDDANVEKEHCCGNCMDCLGLSWRDFM